MHSPALSVTSIRPALPWRLYAVEALASAGTNLLVTAIFFYTAHRFGWGLKQNFLLATGQGVVYIVGAMSAGAYARLLDRRVALALVYVAMTALPLLALRASGPAAIAGLLLAYSGVSAVGWPIMESLVSSDVDAHELSRRQSVYNLVWSSVGVVMLALDGTLIEFWPAGLFMIPAIVHGVSAVLMFLRHDERGDISAMNVRPSKPGDAVPGLSQHDSLTPAHQAPGPEPELLRVRTLALWLSRVALPATYVVIFSLMALMPSLPALQPLSPAMQTLAGSAWMATRTLTFVLLGLTPWWHTRPRLLLAAAGVMLVAFLGVTLRPSDLLPHGSPFNDLAFMIAWQLVLGAALGMIYSASLYFGMVLSEGSTEHGGYHEALIGLGFVLGPGSGALAQTLHPGSVYTGIAAVGLVVALSVGAVAVTSILGAKGERETG